MKAAEKFWRQGLEQPRIEVRASDPGKDFSFALAAVYETPGRTTPIAQKSVEEALPRLRYCSMFFYEEVRSRNTEGLLGRDDVERELHNNLEWTNQRTSEKLPTVISLDQHSRDRDLLHHVADSNVDSLCRETRHATKSRKERRVEISSSLKPQIGLQEGSVDCSPDGAGGGI